MPTFFKLHIKHKQNTHLPRICFDIDFLIRMQAHCNKQTEI